MVELLRNYGAKHMGNLHFMQKRNIRGIMEAALCVYTTVTQDRHTKWKK